MTYATVHDANNNDEGKFCHIPATTTSNYCVDVLWVGEDGYIVLGHTVFVKLGCSTRLPLPKKQQDPLSRTTDQLAGVLQT
jgi:hypothetical protein